MSSFREWVELAANSIDAAGVLVIIAGALYATGRLVLERSRGATGLYHGYRRDMGRAILLGLEFLVAGDIIRTVAVSPTIQNVLVLGLIVLIRTFLSLSLQAELEGRLPWQSSSRPEALEK